MGDFAPASMLLIGIGASNTVMFSTEAKYFKSLASTNSATSAPVAFQGFGRKRQLALCRLKNVLCKTAFAGRSKGDGNEPLPR